ncbi:MAG: amino acid ABC transporter permease [Christensenellales bacterium]
MQKAWQLFYNNFITHEGYKDVLSGLSTTILIAVCGLLIGIVIGTIIAITKVIPQNNPVAKFFSGVSSVYVGFFRGTPIVVQLLLIYFVFCPAVGLNIHKVAVAIMVFGLNSGAYVSEIMRSGILSVDGGQMEAGRSLGLGYCSTMMKIILPQAVKNILPTIGNEFISLIKETSVVSFIAVVDLTKAFKSIADATYEYIIPYCMLALSYLIIIIVITLLLRQLERRLRQSDKR